MDINPLLVIDEGRPASTLDVRILIKPEGGELMPRGNRPPGPAVLRIGPIFASKTCLALFVLLLFPALSQGGVAYSLEGTVIGWTETYRVPGGESLHEAALKKGLGYNEIVDANQDIDPWAPGEGTAILIPKMWVLPHAPMEGIVVNLAEMRLYHYFEARGRTFVRTYPIGIGREAFDTPEGDFTVIEKMKNPSWKVPLSARREDPLLPEVVPPGPDNPLGKHALRLSSPEYLIHGTNRPFGVGRRVSRGCIRLYPADIIELYKSVRIGTPVRIINQPVKAGERGGVVYLEAHQNHLTKSESLLALAREALRDRGLLERTDPNLLREALEGRTGVPVPVSYR